MKLRRELGLRDVTLLSIACIINVRWIPAAAHVGPGSVTLWALAALLLAVPVAIAVSALIVKYPGTGGLYLWTRNDFGPWQGFLCFWTYWNGIAILFPSAAMFYMSVAFYTLGPKYAHLSEDRLWLVAVSLAAIWLALGTNLVGMKIGKWTENVGGACSWIFAGLLAVTAALVWMKRGPATPMHLAPRWNWRTLNFWSSIAYALTGLEMAGMMGEEIRDPERTLPRAGWIASTFASLFYMVGTISLLVILRPEGISEMNGLAETAETAGRVLGAGWLAPVVAVLVLATAVGQFGGLGTSVSRMPFAVGVDGMLPEAFARVHPKWGTPYFSILVFGGVASLLLVTMQLGDTMRAAYEELVSLMVITGLLPYLYMFASAWKAGKRWSAVAGASITALAIVCSVVPTADIANVWLFEGKLAAGTIAVIASAWVVYRRHAKRGLAVRG